MNREMKLCLTNHRSEKALVLVFSRRPVVLVLLCIIQKILVKQTIFIIYLLCHAFKLQFVFDALDICYDFMDELLIR